MNHLLNHHLLIKLQNLGMFDLELNLNILLNIHLRYKQELLDLLLPLFSLTYFFILVSFYSFQIVSYVLKDRKSTRLNSSHVSISYTVFCLNNMINNLKSITITSSKYCI